MSAQAPASHPRRARALTLVGLALLAFAFLGSRSLLEPDEGRYSGVAAQMLRSGDWAVPALNEHTPHFTKPPLTYWTIAAATKLLGHTPWAARLPNGLAWLATVLFVGALARRLAGGAAADAVVGSGAADSAGLTAAAVYATLLLPYVGASVVTTDTLLAAFETGAALGLVGLWLRPGHAARVLAGTCLGLAFLTKGPVGLMPLLPMGILLVARGEARRMTAWLHPAVLAPFLLIGGSWFAWLAVSRPDVLETMLREEIYGRVVEGRFDRHAEWYGALRVYLPAFLLGALPWTPFALARPRRLLDAFRLEHWRRLRRDDPEGLFLWLWLLVPLAVLFLVRSRLPLYLLPSFAPLALLVARRLDLASLLREPSRALVVSWLVLLVGARALTAAIPLEAGSHVLEEGLAEQLRMPAQRIVFVDDSPRWGIGYTFDVAVEGATLRDVEDPFPPIEAVMARPAEGRVFLVRRASEEEFRRRARAAGHRVRWVGAWDHQVYLTTFPSERPGSTNGP